jgi:SAM-dependent methyltransferase
MNTSSDIDARAFHSFEREAWNRASEVYQRYFSELTAQTIEPLLGSVAVSPAPRFLDIASGPGHLAAAAKRRGWSPVAIDFSESMVALGRSLHPGVDFRVGDAEALSFGDAEFDCAAMSFGILHLARPEAAVSEAFRVLRKGGCFGFTTWARREEARGFHVVLYALEQFGDPKVTIPAGPPFFRFSDGDECRRVLELAGFSKATMRQLPLVWRIPSPGEFFNAFYFGSARTGGLLRAQPRDALAKVRDAILTGAAGFQCADHLEIPMPALAVSAVRAR